MTAETPTFIPCLDCPHELQCQILEGCELYRKAIQRNSEQLKPKPDKERDPQSNPFRPSVSEVGERWEPEQ